MADDLNNPTDDPLDLPTLEIPHMLRIEFSSLITINHQIGIEGITQIEQEELSQIKDHDEKSSQRRFFDDLRIAANSLALVAVVARLDHWVMRFCDKLNLEPKKSNQKSRIVRKMESLNDKLGVGPVPLSFFADLVTARDSVVHGDSQSEWDFDGSKREVAAKYMNFYRLEVSEDQVTEAVEKTLEQLIWYEEKSP